MLNFVQALFRRPQPEADMSEINRLRQMRTRTESGPECQSEEQAALVDEVANANEIGDAVELKSGIGTKGGNHEAAAKVVIGRGNSEQALEVKQKWIDECGFKRPNTGKQR